MLLTHLVLFSFFNGASAVSVAVLDVTRPLAATWLGPVRAATWLGPVRAAEPL